MPEPLTFIGGSAILAYLSKDGIEKLLGPTCEYLGGSIRDFAQKRADTIGRIFKNAADKIGEEIEDKGEVPPKVLKAILDDGSFSEDILSIEYFGGILASSRTPTGRDDRGARIAKLVETMSTYQLRSHFLIYSTLKSLSKNKKIDIDPNGRFLLQMFIPGNDYISAMDFDDAEKSQINQLITHVFSSLQDDGLIESNWKTGQVSDLIGAYSSVKEAGILCTPSLTGMELFLWAFGASKMRLEHIFDSDFVAEIEGVPNFVSGSTFTKY